MDRSKDHNDFLARYQGLAFDQRLENGSPSQKADILRNTLAHLQFAQISGLIEESAVRPLIREYESMYANIVDCFDEQTGLNNFAEEALALCSGKKNESKDWKCSLTVDKILAMKGIQQHVRQTKMSNEASLPRNKRNEPLPLCLAENRPVTGAQSSSGFTSAARATQCAGNQSSRMMNLYGNQSRVDNQIPGQSSVRNSSVPEAHQLQSSNRCNDLNNKRPSFAAGGRQAPFGQYGSKQNPPLAEKNVYEQSVGNKRPFGGQAANQYEDDRPAPPQNVFKTAKEQLAIDNQKKYGGGGGRGQGSVNTAAYGTGKKSLGTRRGLNSKFVPPVVNREDDDSGFSNQAANTITRAVMKTGGNDGSGGGGGKYEGIDDDKLKGVEAKMIEMIMNEIMDSGPPLTWDDVAGLEFAKKTIKEIVVWPMLRPDIFTGLRGPPKGLLLFGPPGTGKTLIGKCIASQSKSTFFCISASSLTSKWTVIVVYLSTQCSKVGEGEKMVRALFAVARAQQPAVVFIDEIDSLLTQRTDGENEASRRIKTEFLVQLDGAATSADDRILVIGATNRPQEIDEAARRRFVKRLYIPLPELAARKTIIVNLLKQQAHHLAEDELESICSKTHGFSGADMATLCREAALGPIRDMSFGDIEHISADQVRPITFGDFTDALQNVKPSVSEKDLDQYLQWNQTYGSGSR